MSVICPVCEKKELPGAAELVVGFHHFCPLCDVSRSVSQEGKFILGISWGTLGEIEKRFGNWILTVEEIKRMVKLRSFE